jgi:diadenosine tetraphosphatase ApaH/serine/threonine PP2A family protein phosphatase
VVFRRSEDVFDGFVPEGEHETRLPLAPQVRYLVNPGSVGQPRDGDPRAAFAIYDSDSSSLILHRLAYAVETAQRRIRSAGLPPSLANRLAIGR